ncbi:MAG: ankyrin repeat domain-containing protein, partial [Spiroplasma sp. hy2]|uniref:ankyrin repeat domain-containing protein n=1 Tax=Spiroplasma sp. hy2 TaxID=2490850 RepID=UPI0038487E8A
MKKLLGLLGTIMITGSAIPSIVAAAPNRKHSIKKRQNNENTSTTPKPQDDKQPQFSTTSDSKVDIIEKEITLNENYSDNIQKMLQELIDENYIDPLRRINMGGLISKELDNKTIISKLEEFETKMANWFKNQQNNKDKILILTLKNSNNESVKLVINLNNLYLLGFINNQNQYFYFDDEILKRIEQINQEEVTKLNNLKDKLNNLKENNFLSNEEKVKEYLQQKNEVITLKAKEKNIKRLNYKNEKKYLYNKIENLKGGSLKDDEEKIKSLNKSVIKKYNCQKINLNYTGAYSKDGLDVVIKQNEKQEGKDIFISQDTLNNAIANLSNYDNKQENQTTKDDLVKLIFITSEAVRFQCDEKTLEIFEKIENIDELHKIIAESKNILENIKEKVFNSNQTINWKDYTSQLRGDWKKYSEQLNKFRIKIWDQLIYFNNFINFVNDSKNEIDKFITKIKKINVTEEREQLLQIEQETNLIQKIEKHNLDIKKITNTLFFMKKIWEKMNFTNFKILHLLILESNIDLIKFLIVSGYDVDIQDENGDTPLITTIKENNSIMAKLLIDKGANVNLQNKNRLTPLDYAIDRNNKELVQLLIAKGADVNLENLFNGHTPLITAILNDDLEIAELLIDKGANINFKNKNELNPLFFAILNNFPKMVQLLIKNNVEVESKNKFGLTNINFARYLAMSLENIPDVIKYKDDVNLQNKNGDAILNMKINKNYQKILELLLEYSDKINNQEENGDGPSNTAIVIDNSKI